VHSLDVEIDGREKARIQVMGIGNMGTGKKMTAVLLLLVAAGWAQEAAPVPQQAQTQTQSAPPVLTMDDVVNRAIDREHALLQFLKNRNPLVETYLQNLKPDAELGAVPSQDHYFLGRLDLGDVERQDYLSKDSSFEGRLVGGLAKLYRFEYQPMGFSWMLFADRDDFDRAHYKFHYSGREFLGDVRCIVFDVEPKPDTGKGRFVGRIWVEDQNYNIVRLNGTYEPRPRGSYYFHMDSWRLNLVPGYWIPAYIYSEEGDFSYGAKDKMAFKAQTRIWGYDLKQGGKADELTQLKVDSTVKDESAAAQDASPLEAQREWQQQAEDNVVDRLEEAGLLAPEGDVDKVLQTVVNNLEVTNNINLPRPVRVRVMLTSPLETFSVGNTIVVSRGLIDVLPDEASLAMVLSYELAHIVLGHNLGSKYAFNDRMLFSDDATYKNLGFRHNATEEAEADHKAYELLKNSPYGQKLGTAGLFLRELQARGPALSALLTPHLGNSFVDDKGQVVRLTQVMKEAPALEETKLTQISALPLGGRIKVNPWNDDLDLVKTAPVALTSARDKMPLEVTPFFPRLTRLSVGDSSSGQTTAAAAAPAK
jgi:Peptidase family M48